MLIFVVIGDLAAMSEHAPFDIDSPEVYKASLENESRLLGVNYLDQPDQFLEAHHQFVESIQDKLTETLLGGMKQELATRLSAFLGLNDTEGSEVMEKWLSRSRETVRVLVQDDLTDRFIHGGGNFLGKERQIEMSWRGLVKIISEVAQDEAMKVIVEGLLAHEVLHSFMVAGTVETHFEPVVSAKNGLRLTPIDNPMDKDTYSYQEHGRWLNEATLEYARRNIMGVQTGNYTSGVIVLEVAEALDPGIVRQAARTAFIDGSPGEIFGRFENIFGPYGIEELGLTVERGEYHGTQLLKRELIPKIEPQRQGLAELAFDESSAKYAALAEPAT